MVRPQLETDDPPRAAAVLRQLLSILADYPPVRAEFDAWIDSIKTRLPSRVVDIPSALSALFADRDDARERLTTFVTTSMDLPKYAAWLSPVLQFWFDASVLGAAVTITEPEAVEPAPLETAPRFAPRDRVAQNTWWRPTGYRGPRSDYDDAACQRDVRWWFEYTVELMDSAELAPDYARIKARKTRSHQKAVDDGIARVTKILD